MRTALTLVLLGPLCAGQAASPVSASDVRVETRILPSHDLPPGTMAAMLVSTAISADGGIVVVSVADNLGGWSGEPSPVWVHDVEKGEARQLPVERDGQPCKFVGKAG